jgi:hypothetical protein
LGKPVDIKQQGTPQSIAEGFSGGVLEKLISETALDLGGNVHIPIIKTLDVFCFPNCASGLQIDW